jgi:hypothetical protein
MPDMDCLLGFIGRIFGLLLVNRDVNLKNSRRTVPFSGRVSILIVGFQKKPLMT